MTIITPTINRALDAWKSLVLLDGSVLDGPFTFHSDGTIGAYPRYVRGDGTTVFLHAVAVART